MTLNIDALIRSMGKTYQDIFDAGLIPYKTKPSASSGEPEIFLDMAKEGVFLIFGRSDRKLIGVELNFQNKKIKNWIFPNELPLGLKDKMSREEIYKIFGAPQKSADPRVVMKQAIGRTDWYSLSDFHTPLSMRVRYDLAENLEAVWFLPTSKVY